jgi:glycine cleavage system transcriptional repressor
MTTFVLTLTGPDRIGIVDDLTGLLLERGGNVETSRMARLGGEFAVLLLATMPAERFERLDEELEPLRSRGYAVSLVPAGRSVAELPPGWAAFRVEVEGADHEGIIHDVAHYLSARGINIESADSDCTPAPTSGVPLFSMTARISVPPSLSDWESGLHEIGTQRNLDIRVSPMSGR